MQPVATFFLTKRCIMYTGLSYQRKNKKNSLDCMVYFSSSSDWMKENLNWLYDPKT